MNNKKDLDEIKEALKRAEKEAASRNIKNIMKRPEIVKDKVEVRKAAPRKMTIETIVNWGNKILDEGFTMVPNVLIDNYKNIGISDTQMLVLLALMKFAFRGRQPYPSQKTLAEITGFATRTIIRATNSLKMKGYLTVTKRYIHNKKRNPQRTSNKYNLKGLMEKLNSLEDEK